MHVRQHARLACALQDAVGGPDRALEILEPTASKMGRTHLYDCRNFNSGRTMPAGAIAVLEQHQRFPIYSASMARLPAAIVDQVNPSAEICEACEDLLAAQRILRRAAEAGPVNETTARLIEPLLQAVEAHIHRVRASIGVPVQGLRIAA